MGFDARESLYLDDPKYIDINGKELDEEDVLDLAYDNIDASMSRKELVRSYLESLTEDEIFEWATNSSREFPDD